MRYLSNYSTGYMGAQLAAEALRRGHRVTVISGPVTEPLPAGARVVRIERVRELERELRRQARRADAVIMAAAVADYEPVRAAAKKLRRQGTLTMALRATPDVIGRLPRRRGQVVAGFALETAPVVLRAARKLREKRLDVLIAQQAGSPLRARRASGPFGRSAVRAWLLERGRTAVALGQISKPRIARALLDKLESLWYRQPHATRGR